MRGQGSTGLDQIRARARHAQDILGPLGVRDASLHGAAVPPATIDKIARDHTRGPRHVAARRQCARARAHRGAERLLDAALDALARTTELDHRQSDEGALARLLDRDVVLDVDHPPPPPDDGDPDRLARVLVAAPAGPPRSQGAPATAW